MDSMKYISVIILSVFFVGCASTRTDSSNPSLQSPLIAKAGTSFNLEMGSSDRIKFTDDASARPPTIALVHSRSNDARASLAYGFNDNFDLSAGITSTSGFVVSSRARFSGDAKSTWATAGTLFLNYDSNEQSGDQNGEFGPGGFNWKSTAVSTLAAVGVAIGYRASENILVIANAGVGQTNAKMDLKQDPGGSDPGGNYSSEVKAPLQNVGLGFTFGHGTLTTVGVMYTHKEWKDSALGDTSTTHAILKLETN